MAPGEFAPLWEGGLFSENRIVGSVDVPIISEHRYRAIRSEYKNGVAKAYIVNITQKLVIFECHNNEDKMYQYILTLIPDRDFYATNKGDISDLLINSRVKSKFSGIALHHSVLGGRLVDVVRYNKGQIVDKVYLNVPLEQRKELIPKAKKLIGALQIAKSITIATRMEGGYDDYDYVIDEWYEYGDYPDEGPYDDLYLDEYDPQYEGYVDPNDKGEGYEDYQDHDDPGPTPPDEDGGTDTEPAHTTHANSLIKALGNKIDGIKDKVTIVSKVLTGTNFAQILMTGNDLFKQTNLTISVSSSLEGNALQVVMGHEFMHLVLIEISRDAGSAQALGRSNSELLTDINRFGINEGHHAYMGGNIDELEQLLRDAYPGESEEFYDYGKWGGGAMNSEEYEKLPDVEKDAIESYLNSLGIY